MPKFSVSNLIRFIKDGGMVFIDEAYCMVSDIKDLPSNMEFEFDYTPGGMSLHLKTIK